ncbi:MAG: hypothetical protein PUP93_16170 [Rhizonema sp. NSF051]|nr:hypothetical protein [Rhizonema sp. NSF051]
MKRTTRIVSIKYTHICLACYSLEHLHTELVLAKTPEEGYQSALGLKADWETCLYQSQNQNQIFPFHLGRQDISDKFRISQKLYGRENESVKVPLR